MFLNYSSLSHTKYDKRPGREYFTGSALSRRKYKAKQYYGDGSPGDPMSTEFLNPSHILEKGITAFVNIKPTYEQIIKGREPLQWWYKDYKKTRPAPVKMSLRTKIKIKNKLKAWYFAQTKKRRFPVFVFCTLTLTGDYPPEFTDKDCNKMFNVWLTKIRKIYGKFNYLWVAEKQKNGRLHYHLITDKFIHINSCQYHWLKTLKTYGFTVRTDLQDIRKNGFTYKGESGKQIKRFKENPLDVKQVRPYYSKSTKKPFSVLKAIGRYITKYISKNDSEIFAQLWNCSVSISHIATGIVKIMTQETFEMLVEQQKKLTKLDLKVKEIKDGVFVFPILIFSVELRVLFAPLLDFNADFI